ncbi:reverse transcriptase zinc-binding domain-containing protein [Tanacetum coccineum]
MWMAIQERLVTQDRLARWYPSKTFSCALCDKCPDSHEHLFFKCEFSKTLWQAMVQKMNCNLPNKCSLLIPSMISLGFSNSIGTITIRLLIGAIVYQIWQERITRILQDKKKTQDVICQQIMEGIRLKLMSLTVKYFMQSKVWKKDGIENRIGSYRDGWTSIMWMMPLMDANPMISFVRWAAKEIMWLPS